MAGLLRNLPMERMNQRRARAGMGEYVPQEPTQTAGQAAADMLGGVALGSSMIPFYGDVAGLGADAAMYAAYPEERTLGNYALTALGVLPFVPAASAVRAGEKAVDTYYHGGKLTGPIKEKEGLFDGIFLSPSDTSARSHGGDLYSFEIPPDKIASSGDFIGYSDLPWEQQKAAILRTNRRIDPDGPDFDLWYKAVAEDRADQLDSDDLARIFGKENWSENLWEAQRQRGRLAKELGYDAVNMSDEHGTSVLLVRDRPYTPANTALDMSQEARMARAKDMGFDINTVLYHYTDKLQEGEDFTEFKPSTWGKLGPGVYAATEPSYSERYVTNFGRGARFGENARAIPIYSRGKLADIPEQQKAMDIAIKRLNERLKGRGPSGKEWENEITAVLMEQGYAGKRVGPEVVIFDPANIRSVNAAFDPTKRDSANLMYGIGATGLLGGIRQQREDERKK